MKKVKKRIDDRLQMFQTVEETSNGSPIGDRLARKKKIKKFDALKKTLVKKSSKTELITVLRRNSDALKLCGDELLLRKKKKNEHVASKCHEKNSVTENQLTKNLKKKKQIISDSLERSTNDAHVKKKTKIKSDALEDSVSHEMKKGPQKIMQEPLHLDSISHLKKNGGMKGALSNNNRKKCEDPGSRKRKKGPTEKKSEDPNEKNEKLRGELEDSAGRQRKNDPTKIIAESKIEKMRRKPEDSAVRKRKKGLTMNTSEVEKKQLDKDSISRKTHKEGCKRKKGLTTNLLEVEKKQQEEDSISCKTYSAAKSSSTKGLPKKARVVKKKKKRAIAESSSDENGYDNVAEDTFSVEECLEENDAKISSIFGPKKCSTARSSSTKGLLKKAHVQKKKGILDSSSGDDESSTAEDHTVYDTFLMSLNIKNDSVNRSSNSLYLHSSSDDDSFLENEDSHKIDLLLDEDDSINDLYSEDEDSDNDLLLEDEDSHNNLFLEDEDSHNNEVIRRKESLIDDDLYALNCSKFPVEDSSSAEGIVEEISKPAWFNFKGLVTVHCAGNKRGRRPDFPEEETPGDKDLQAIEDLAGAIEDVLSDYGKGFQVSRPVDVFEAKTDGDSKSAEPSNGTNPESHLSSNGDNSTDPREVSDECYSDKSDDESSRGNLSDEVTDVEDGPIETGQYLSCPVEDGVILLLLENCLLYVFGQMKLSVLRGSVEILGTTLTTTAQGVNVYSLRGSSFLSIKNTNEQVDLDGLRTLAENLKLIRPDDLSNILKFAQPKSSLVLCRDLNERQMDFLNVNMAQLLTPKGVMFKFRNYLSDGWQVVRRSPEWDDLLVKIRDDSRLLLCGGKGVGKSTLLRYLVNKLLDRYRKVVVIDLDPGQPEFTVPGCISRLEIDQPLLGPNYTHLKQPDRCVFVPNIDVTSDFSTYLLCVKELARQCETASGVPTIINHMGFTRGIGINLASSAICDLGPNLVVQIESEMGSKNFRTDLTVDEVKRHAGYIDGVIDADVNHELVKLRSCVDSSRSWVLQPRQVREMCILTYFSRVLPDGCNFLTEPGVKIYKTDMKDIKIFFDGKECDPKVVNANIVALCTLARWAEDKPIFNCHGWGIVRGISDEFNYLALLTPLDGAELEKVDCLVLGSVTLPPSVYIRNHCKIRGTVPYVYEGNLQDFAKNPKRSILHRMRPETD